MQARDRGEVETLSEGTIGAAVVVLRSGLGQPRLLRPGGPTCGTPPPIYPGGADSRRVARPSAMQRLTLVLVQPRDSAISV